MRDRRYCLVCNLKRLPDNRYYRAARFILPYHRHIITTRDVRLTHFAVYVTFMSNAIKFTLYLNEYTMIASGMDTHILGSRGVYGVNSLVGRQYVCK